MTRRSPPETRGLDRIPTPDDLDRAPELAILAALDHTLELAAAALACAHPELRDPESATAHRPNAQSFAIANTLVRRSRALQRALRAYRNTLERRPRPEDLLQPDF